MRISELSRGSGTSVATIKYYIREGLLPVGERTAPNRADYDAHHLDRLRLLRALREVAGLGIAAIGRIVQSLETREAGDLTAFTTMLDAVALDRSNRVRAPEIAAEYERAMADVDALLEQLDWQID